jgi:hypothetical protein
MRPKNWRRFQHFKDRKPPWIKLYRDLLDDLDWHRLDGEAAKFLVQLWLLASEDDDGECPSVDVIAFRFRMSPERVTSMISKVSAWMEGDDITAISDRYQDDLVETETETERETDKRQYAPEFEQVWAIHRRGAKGKAAAAYAKAIRKTTQDVITQSLKAYTDTLRPPQFTGQHLHRWLDEERWEEQAGDPPIDIMAEYERQRRIIYG